MGNPALEEFRAILAKKLAEVLLGDTAAMMVAEPQVTEEIQISEPRAFTKGAIMRAVAEITAGWRAKYHRNMIRDSHGVTQDGLDLAGPVYDPITRVVRLKVSTHIDRGETPTEVTEREERAAAYLWKPENGPPPKRVTLMQLLDQDIWWVPKDAEPLRLVDMAESHRRNLAGFLRRNAARYKHAEWDEMLWSMTGPLGPSGDGAIDMAESELNRLEQEDPLEWLGAKPLMQALVPTVYLWLKRNEVGGGYFCHAVREDGLLVATAAAGRRKKAVEAAQPPAAEQDYRQALSGIGPAFYRLVTVRDDDAPPEPVRVAFAETSTEE